MEGGTAVPRRTAGPRVLGDKCLTLVRPQPARPLRPPRTLSGFPCWKRRKPFPALLAWPLGPHPLVLDTVAISPLVSGWGQPSPPCPRPSWVLVAAKRLSPCPQLSLRLSHSGRDSRPLRAARPSPLHPCSVPFSSDCSHSLVPVLWQLSARETPTSGWQAGGAGFSPGGACGFQSLLQQTAALRWGQGVEAAGLSSSPGPSSGSLYCPRAGPCSPGP